MDLRIQSHIRFGVQNAVFYLNFWIDFFGGIDGKLL